MRKAYFSSMDTLLGKIFVASTEEGLCKVHFGDDKTEDFFAWLAEHFECYEEDLSQNQHVMDELAKYFRGELKKFTVKLHLMGTEFQKKVWRTLMEIPYGQVVSYKDVAMAAGSPRGYRAVGMANNRNNIPIIIPCHRVVGHSGDLVGYGGGLHIKIRLLELEGIHVNQGKVVTRK